MSFTNHSFAHYFNYPSFAECQSSLNICTFLTYLINHNLTLTFIVMISVKNCTFIYISLFISSHTYIQILLSLFIYSSNNPISLMFYLDLIELNSLSSFYKFLPTPVQFFCIFGSSSPRVTGVTHVGVIDLFTTITVYVG